MSGKLPANLVGFARFLRRAGVPAGPAQVVEATQALEAVGLSRREDVYWALHAVFVKRMEHRLLFQLAFRRFWRDSERPADIFDLLPPDRFGRRQRAPEPGARRIQEAWKPVAATPDRQPAQPEDGTRAGTYSAAEVLRQRDFQQMTAEELRRAQEVVARMNLGARPIRARRFRRDPHGGRIDVRATLRASLRSGGDPAPLKWRRMSERAPAIVAVCDISGSMDAYSRMILHFLHTLTKESDRVFTFLFGTRLTNATRTLSRRDVDEALAGLSHLVDDWAGGTRIGLCLETFNRVWSRRVLSQGAVVLLITDGLDRGDLELLGRQVERLRKSCRRLIWLNPLLRYQAFEPKAGGVRQIMPWVDDFRPVHNLDSLEGLARALRAGPRPSASVPQ